ncbi:hypothetical protein J3R83DRAFT_135 [Lanmaoa asiatica]|nr:hypothetical protein J3R83DRAFT_135 [Lanmaoa asiatica]
MTTLAAVQRVLSSHPGILQVTIQQLATFINLAGSLRRDILLVQPAAQPEDKPPEYLSDSIQRFLADACDLSYEQPIEKYALFEQHGLSHGILSDALFPPRHTCKNDRCPRTLKGQLLTKAEQHDAVLYTLDQGPVATKHVHLQYCKITYELNFYIEGQHRYYYDTMPNIIQVSTHAFLEKRVIDLFDNLANLSWYAFNPEHCVVIPLIIITKVAPISIDGPKSAVGLTQQNVWDAFVIKALLLDSLRRQSMLVVPKGEQKDRFTQAIKERNLRIQLYGQPELKHYCNKCTRFYKDANGIGMVHVIWFVPTH